MLNSQWRKRLILIGAGIAILLLLIQLQNRRIQQLDSLDEKIHVIDELQKTQPTNPQKIPTH